MTEDKSARVEALWIKRVSKGPMDAVPTADLVAGQGMVGNTNQGGRRQVTVLSREAWETTERALGTSLDPAVRRANVLVSGVDLEQSRERVLALGECRLRIRGETRPCTLMESTRAGLRDALDPEWRGGAFGEVIEGGRIAIGDPVAWVEESP